MLMGGKFKAMVDRLLRAFPPAPSVHHQNLVAVTLAGMWRSSCLPLISIIAGWGRRELYVFAFWPLVSVI